MKTSNILVIITITITFGALLTYDFFIKEVYVSGVYKIPFYNYTALPEKDFDRIDMQSSTTANVKIVQGPFSVRLDPAAADYVRLHQQGEQLSVAVIFPANYRGNPNEYTLVISCPTLREVTTGATYYVGKRAITDTVVRDDWRMRKVIIDGFSQDSLFISQDYASTVVLRNNTIRSVTAVIGKSPGSGSDLAINAGNHIRNCEVSAGNKSRFFLQNADLANLHYKIGDSANIIVTGNAQHLLNNSKNGLK